MRLHLKAAGQKFLKVAGASLEVEHALAAIATEVMVMTSRQWLVALWPDAQINRFEPALFLSEFHRPIHRRDTQPGRQSGDALGDLLRRQRPRRFFKHLTDGFTLVGLAAH